MSSSQPHLGFNGVYELDFDNGVLDFADPLAAADDIHASSFGSIGLPGGSSNNFKATRNANGDAAGRPPDNIWGEPNAAPDVDSHEFTNPFMSNVQDHSRRETTSVPEASSNASAILPSDNVLPLERHRSKLKRTRFSESIWSNKRPAIEKYFHQDGLEPMMRKMRADDFYPS
ncbi:MAG: hypothetical protein Q9167_007907 [Letrouitia subvulpina]